MKLRITSHAIEQYCLRVHRDIQYYLEHPEVTEEIRARLAEARKSGYNPKLFFRGRPHIRSDNVIMLQDNSLIYAIRDNELITLFPAPGADHVNDMLRAAIKRRHS